MQYARLKLQHWPAPSLLQHLAHFLPLQQLPFVDQDYGGDYPVVLGVLLITSSAVVFFTIIVDLIYTVVDPRIRLN